MHWVEVSLPVPFFHTSKLNCKWIKKKKTKKNDRMYRALTHCSFTSKEDYKAETIPRILFWVHSKGQTASVRRLLPDERWVTLSVRMVDFRHFAHGAALLRVAWDEKEPVVHPIGEDAWKQNKPPDFSQNDLQVVTTRSVKV